MDREGAEPDGSLDAHLLDAVDVGLRLERRILDPRDRERGRQQVVARSVQRLLQIRGHLDDARREI